MKGKSNSKTKKNLILQFYHTLYREFGKQNWWPADAPFEVIIGAILTQNTSWNNVKKAIENLKKNDFIDAKKLFQLDTEKLKELIRPAGFFNQKAKTIKNFLTFLFSNYDGNLNNLLNEEDDTLRYKLLHIKGIGKETADSIILYAAGKPAFVIDKYTKRIFIRHNIINNQDIEYDELQKIIQNNIPKKTELYNEYHALLVKVGKELCKTKPLCWKCPLNIFLMRKYRHFFSKK